MRTKTKTKTWETMRRSARRILPALLLLGGVAAVLPFSNNASAASTAWGPERTTYTWAEPADKVTFNSITDNPKIGDERNFVRIRKANTEDTLVDKVELEVGQEYEVSIWFHNNAKSKLNTKEYGGVGIATDVRLRVEAPEIINAGTNGIIKGIISSTNSDPSEVWDIAYAYSKSTVLTRYVANSATIHSLGNIDGQILSSEAMFGEQGAKLGYWNDLWGTLPGCNEYSGYVTYRFVVDQPNFDISKTVSKEKEQNYVEKITVNPGDTLDFRIDYKNTGTINQKSIIVYDQMPNGLNYINGTSFFTASFNESGNFVSDKLFDGGINLGDYKPGESMYLTYKVEVADDKTIFPCGDTVVYNNASVATANGTGYDKVEITVHRDCTPEELPKTGPTEIVMALIVVTGIGVGGAYYIASRRQLNKISSK
ncbi:MAG: hypothetical protein Q4E70_03670 [Candidatus Saccharibacteria bacterium]|nr:DUF11 domain-containing protein [Candidatus Saccharibacteria bacterium]MDO4967825.1 hypothetical protein [Candidatus Saccharibacteria bacterium]